MGADEVEHRARALARSLAKSAAKLLKEQRGALGRAEHHDRVHIGDVDTLVEQIDREDHPDAAGREVAQSPFALLTWAVAPDGNRRDALPVEVPGHEASVLDAHAEAKSTHRRDIDARRHFLDDGSRPCVRAGVELGERVDVISPPPTPRDVPEVQTVVHSVVHERGEMLLVDRVPEA